MLILANILCESIVLIKKYYLAEICRIIEILTHFYIIIIRTPARS